MRWLLSLVILTPSSCYSYQNYHWQAGFPTPLTGVGQDLVQAQGAFLLKQQDYLQRRLGQVQPMIRWVARQVEARWAFICLRWPCLARSTPSRS